MRVPASSSGVFDSEAGEAGELEARETGGRAREGSR